MTLLCFFFCNSEFHGKADLQANKNKNNICLKIGLAMKLCVAQSTEVSFEPCSFYFAQELREGNFTGVPQEQIRVEVARGQRPLCARKRRKPRSFFGSEIYALG